MAVNVLRIFGNCALVRSCIPPMRLDCVHIHLACRKIEQLSGGLLEGDTLCVETWSSYLINVTQLKELFMKELLQKIANMNVMHCVDNLKKKIVQQFSQFPRYCVRGHTLFCTFHFVLSCFFTSTDFLSIAHLFDDVFSHIFVHLILYATWQYSRFKISQKSSCRTF